MSAQGKRDLTKEKFWRRALQRFAASGKTRAQFCAEEGLAVHAFDYWSRVILERDAERQSGAPPSRPDPVTFLPVVIPEERGQQVSGPQQPVAEIVFAGGSVLLFGGIGSSMLRELFRAVRESMI